MRILLVLVCLGLYGQTADERRLLHDWAGLTVYGSDNSELKQPPQVVFLGDDITEKWTGFFPGKPYVNRGISRQTSAQMLVRFRQDVIALKPKVVVIMAGTNDIAGTAGPITEAMSGENFMSMVELAKVNNIRVILASLTPICDCYTKLTTRRPVGKILGLNNWLKAYAARSGSVYLDFYPALVEGRAMKKELTVDGLIPNEAGYAIMASLAEKAITQALN
jgi:lysophospholipase L1-like esterase